MIRTAGHVVRHGSRVVHALLVTAMGLLVATTVALAALALRLSSGPINLSWASASFGDRFILNGGGIGVSFDGVALAWDGFQSGVGFPLDLHLDNVRLTDAEARDVATARRAFVSLALGPLFLGNIVPHAVELDDGVVTLTQEQLTAPGPDTPATPATGTSTQRPASRFSLDDLVRRTDALRQLSHIRVRNFKLTIRGAALPVAWQASLDQLDLERKAGGTITGSAHLPFTLGDQTGELTLRASIPRDGDGQIDAALSPIQPASIGTLLPQLSFLTALRAPVSVEATLTLDHGLQPVRGHAQVKLAAGSIDVGAGSVAINAGTIALSGTPNRLVIESAHLGLPAAKPGAVTDLSLNGTLERTADRLTAALTAAIDHLDMTDLPALWPTGFGGGARPWIVQNVSAGVVSHAGATIVAETGTDFNDVTVTKATADLDADNVSLTWLDQMPPIERARVHLHLIDPDQLSITMPSGHQRMSDGSADLLIHDGQMLITGLSKPDQDTKIDLHVDGPVTSALTLLKEPRLRLLSKHPVDFQDPSGDASITIGLGFPLLNKLLADDVAFQVAAHLEKVRIARLVAGRDLTGGILDLTADKDGLTLKGTGAVAAIPVAATGSIDFNAGPPDQVLQRIDASARPSADQLDAAGIPIGDVLISGDVPMTASLLERRNGEGSVALTADLGGAALQIKPLGWSKPTNSPSKASATIGLLNDRLTAIRQVAVEGADLSVIGSATVTDGAVRSIMIDRARIGKTDMHGAVQLPDGQPIDIVLSGQQIDLSAELERPAEQTPSGGKPLPDWTVNGQFTRVLLARGERADSLVAQATSVGSSLRRLDVTGSIAPGSAFSAYIGGSAGSRRLTVDAADAGALLRGLGIVKSLRSGRLTVRGSYDDLAPGHPLTGTAEISDARLVDAPVMSKLLQAATLYGVADLLSGPGIGITRMIVPFSYRNQQLTVIDGRVFSSSIGMTSKGVVDLSANRLALTGTIVPAYVLNSALGRIPVVGKLFSPEVGGGLFAARYSVDGPFADPSISVNPLSMLTPGFLRGLFDTGDKSR